MVALTKLPYWLCRNEVPDEQLGEVFLREVIQTTVAYGCRDMIVALAPYKSPELHVDIFGWMVFAVLLELVDGTPAISVSEVGGNNNTPTSVSSSHFLRMGFLEDLCGQNGLAHHLWWK